MAVVGIDLGNLNIVIAQAQRGGVDVLLNDSSNRQNPNMVSFSEKQRFMGEGASTLARSNFQNTIFGMKRLIGRSFAEPEVQEEIKGLPFKVVATPSGGVAYEVTYDGESKLFTPEQITAMMFLKVESIVKSANNQVGIADAVVGIPGWFTDAQRRAVLDAADIAGLNVLRLLHESTAIALSYGIYKSVRNLFHESEPQHVLFLDMGHSNYSASVVAFIQGKLIVKSAVYDRSLGGRSFDSVIVNFLAEKFLEKYKKDPKTSIKAMLKLEAAAEKAKKTLSPAGVSAASVSVECVMDEIDLNVTLQLEEFEARCQPLLARLEGPIRQALAEAGVGVEQLANVEIVGGATRVNCVKLRLAEMLQLDKSKLNYGLGTTLNADEAVSRGCALQAAILSSRFQVKPFELWEANPYPIRLTWEDANGMGAEAAATEGDEGDAQVKDGENTLLLFKRNDKVPTEKRVTFSKSASFSLTATYDESATALLPPGSKTHIGTYHVKLPADSAAKSKVRVSLVYNVHGLLNLSQAQLMEEVAAAAPAPAPATTEEEKKDDKKGEQPPATPKEAPEGEEKKDEPAKADGKAATKKYKKVALDTSADVSGLTKAQKDLYIEDESKMQQQDRIIKETADQRNALESYIYDLKNKLLDALKPYTTEDAAKSFLGKLETTENWLYDEGFDSTKTIYAQKLADLKSVGDPMERRQDEASKRDGEKEELVRSLEEYKALVKSSDEKYAHITDEERTQAREEINKTETWLYDNLAAQADLPLHADPVLTVAGMREKNSHLTKTVMNVMNKPKPAPPAPAPAPEPAKKEQADSKAEAGAAEGGAEGMNVDEPAAEGSNGATPMDESS